MKKHTNNTLKLSMGILAGSLLAGCGGVDGVTGTSTDDVNEAVQNVSNAVNSYIDNVTGKTKGTAISARFLDSAVSNLQYKSNSYNGYTGTNGNFTCASGEEVEFVIGSLSLGTSICQSVITPQTLAAPKTKQVVQTTTNASGVTTSTGSTVETVVGSVVSTDDLVLNRVRLLMTLDTDANAANGIALPAATEQAKVTTTTLDFAATTFDNDVQAVLNAMTINGSLVTKAAAEAHFVNGTLADLVKVDTNYYSLNTGSYDEYNEDLYSSSNDGNYDNDDNGNDRD